MASSSSSLTRQIDEDTNTDHLSQKHQSDADGTDRRSSESQDLDEYSTSGVEVVSFSNNRNIEKGDTPSVEQTSFSEDREHEKDDIRSVDQTSLSDTRDHEEGDTCSVEHASLSINQDLEKGSILNVRQDLNDGLEKRADIDVHELVLYLRHKSLISAEKARDILRQAESASRLRTLIQYIEEQCPSRRMSLCQAIDVMYPHVTRQISQTITAKNEDEEALYVEGHFVQLAAGSPPPGDSDYTVTGVVMPSQLDDEEPEGKSPLTLMVKRPCTAYELPIIRPNIDSLYQRNTKGKQLADFNINQVDADKIVELNRNALLFLCDGSFPTSASYIGVVDVCCRRLLVPTSAVQLYGDPSGEDWFYPASLASTQATMILTRMGLQGCFLVYRRVADKSQYTLSVCMRPHQVYHYHIRQQHGRCFWLPNGPRFMNLASLVKYYERNRGQICCRLRFSPQTMDYQLDPTTRLQPHRVFDQTQVRFTSDQKLQMPQWASINGHTVILENSQTIKFTPYYQEELLYISTFLDSLEHANIARFYGLYWNPPDSGLMFENKSSLPLQEYLQGDQFGTCNTQLIVDLCSQVMSVLVYMENRHFILHRDLGAHSWLMDSQAHLKLANFHMARYVYDDEYMVEPGEVIGVRWAAPEILNTGKFSTKSEMWTAGVLLWQILSKGQDPFPSLSNKQVIETLVRGDSLAIPKDCPAILRSVLLLSMAHDRRKRPQAGDLLVALQNMTDLYDTNQVLLDSIVEKLNDDTEKAGDTQPATNSHIYTDDHVKKPENPDAQNSSSESQLTGEYDPVYQQPAIKLDGEMKTDKIKSGSKNEDYESPAESWPAQPHAAAPAAASRHAKWIMTGWDMKLPTGFQLQDCYSMPREFSDDHIVGDLKTCLRYDHFGKKNDALRIDLCLQIASALSYFYDKKYLLHRCLLADTCLVRGNTLLLGNYGQARFVDGENAYIVDPKEEFPIRWSAPEVVFSQTYSTMSDIWSAGVVFWEIFNDGALPYKGELNKDVIHKLEKRRLRLKQTDRCPKGVYRLIKACQDYDPASRPSAAQLCGLLKKMKDNQSWQIAPTDVRKAPESAPENPNEEGRIAFCGVFCQKAVDPDSIVGDLHMCLETKKLNLQEPSVPLNLCLQLFSALIYMNKQKYILHRHIVPMNCLMCVSGRLKLCDGGLTRIVEKDFFQPDEVTWKGYVGRVPIKWCAPETLQQGISTTKSDVWMAAVSCCQIYNWGRRPFPHLENSEAAQAILRGERLAKPDLCPSHIFEILLSCWERKMSTRPNAKAVFQNLSKFTQPEKQVEVYEPLP